MEYYARPFSRVRAPPVATLREKRPGLLQGHCGTALELCPPSAEIPIGLNRASFHSLEMERQNDEKRRGEKGSEARRGQS